MRISDWSSDVCSSDLRPAPAFQIRHRHIDAARGLFQRGRLNFYAKSIQIRCVARGSAVAPEFSIKLAAGLRLSLFCALIALAACQRDPGASAGGVLPDFAEDRKSTRLNSSH